MTKRGAIRNKTLGRQISDFSGLRYGDAGRITPTNIDAAVDFRGKVFVTAEFKQTGAWLLRGQQFYLERMTDTLQAGGGDAYLYVCDHDTPDEEEIQAANTLVREYRYKGQWRQFSSPTTLKEAIDRNLRDAGLSHLIWTE